MYGLANNTRESRREQGQRNSEHRGRKHKKCSMTSNLFFSFTLFLIYCHFKHSHICIFVYERYVAFYSMPDFHGFILRIFLFFLSMQIGCFAQCKCRQFESGSFEIFLSPDNVSRALSEICLDNRLLPILR